MLPFVCYIVWFQVMYSCVFYVALALVLCCEGVYSSPTSSYECGGCMMLINELEVSIKKIDPKKRIEVGSFRVNPKGDQQGIQHKQFARSESHLNEILEGACEKSKEYKLVVNTLTGKAVFVHKDATYLKGDENSTMRSKLHGACNDLVDSHEDEIIKFLGVERADPVKEFCQEELGVCSSVDVSPLPPNEPEPEELEDLDLNDEL